MCIYIFTNTRKCARALQREHKSNAIHFDLRNVVSIYLTQARFPWNVYHVLQNYGNTTIKFMFEGSQYFIPLEE